MGMGTGFPGSFAVANGTFGGYNTAPWTNAYAQGANAFGGFNNGYGIGPMTGMNTGQATPNSLFTLGNSPNDSTTVTGVATTTAGATSRTRAKATKSRSRTKRARSPSS
jgi:hypothetical protein